MTTKIEIKKIQNLEVPLNDSLIYYYSVSSYTKLQNLLRYSETIQSTFEAHEIIDSFYLGSMESAFAYDTLREIGITKILSIIPGFEAPYPNDFEYLIIDALDTQNTKICNVFDECNKFLDKAFEANEKVLIHCLAGRSRSATILASFLIYKFGITPEHAIKFIKKVREIVEPNENFYLQLENYFRTLYCEKQG